METRTETELYSTTTTILAAWLRAQGFEIACIDDDSNPCRFLFEDTPPLRESIRQWDLMKGDSDIVQRVYHNYRDLLHKTHPKVGRL